MSYREYVTKSLTLIPQSMYLTRDWYDVISSSRDMRPDKSAEEIIDDVISRIEDES